MTTYQIVAATFEGSDAAQTAQAAAQAVASQFQHIRNHNVALLVRAANGELQIRESAEAQEIGRDTTIGTVLGWLAGFTNTLVGGPLGPAEGAPLGGALGRETSADSDTGFANDFLHELGATLAAGQAAVLAAVPADEAAAMSELLRSHGGNASQRELKPDALA